MQSEGMADPKHQICKGCFLSLLLFTCIAQAIPAHLLPSFLGNVFMINCPLPSNSHSPCCSASHYPCLILLVCLQMYSLAFFQLNLILLFLAHVANLSRGPYVSTALVPKSQSILIQTFLQCPHTSQKHKLDGLPAWVITSSVPAFWHEHCLWSRT